MTYSKCPTCGSSVTVAGHTTRHYVPIDVEAKDSSHLAIVSALEAELETEKMRLAACGVAAMQNTEGSAKERITKENPYWTASYRDVCAAVDREISLRKERDKWKWEYENLCKFATDFENQRDKYKAALNRSAVHLDILTARMRGCHEETGKHELLDEAEAFCKEAMEALKPQQECKHEKVYVSERGLPYCKQCHARMVK